MNFCTCGKLLTPTDYGFVCICGKKYDSSGQPITEDEEELRQKEADRIKKRKAYRYKYPNMGDGIEVRNTVVVKESDYNKGME